MPSDSVDVQAANTVASISTILTPAQPTLLGIPAEIRGQILEYLLGDVSRLDDVPYIIARRMRGKWWPGFCVICDEIVSDFDDKMCYNCREDTRCDDCREPQSDCECTSESDEDCESEEDNGDVLQEDAEKDNQSSESQSSPSHQTLQEQDEPSSSDMSDCSQTSTAEIEAIKEWWDQQLDGPHPENAKEVYHASNPTYQLSGQILRVSKKLLFEGKDLSYDDKDLGILYHVAAGEIARGYVLGSNSLTSALQKHPDMRRISEWHIGIFLDAA